MPTENEMRAMLKANGATVRHTADAEYWYHRRWWQGLPLGLAFVEMEREVKRCKARLDELHALKRAGWRHRDADAQGGPGWEHPAYPGRHNRQRAFSLLAREVRERFNNVANGRD